MFILYIHYRFMTTPAVTVRTCIILKPQLTGSKRYHPRPLVHFLCVLDIYMTAGSELGLWYGPVIGVLISRYPDFKSPISHFLGPISQFKFQYPVTCSILWNEKHTYIGYQTSICLSIKLLRYRLNQFMSGLWRIQSQLLAWKKNMQHVWSDLYPNPYMTSHKWFNWWCINRSVW